MTAPANLLWIQDTPLCAPGWCTCGQQGSHSSPQTPLFSCLCGWPWLPKPAHQPLSFAGQVPLPATTTPPPLLAQLCTHSSLRSEPGMGQGGTPPLTAALPPPMLPLLPTSPYLPQSPHPALAPRPSLLSAWPPPDFLFPPFLALQFGESGFLSAGTGAARPPLFPHPLPSLFPLQPPLLSPRLLTHPLPLPLPPSFSPTSLFQLRTGSSGQFPHCSASGEETAPLR